MPIGQLFTIPDLPDPPRGARSLMLIVLDSLRYDAWTAANLKHLDRLGGVERRYSYASWTSPSHYNLLTGLLPHSRPDSISAFEYFTQEFMKFGDRLQIDVAEIQQHLAPSLFLPTFFRALGYHTRALVSMPVLNNHTAINRDFESYQLVNKPPAYMASIMDLIEFDSERPTFYMLNIGETHYPYQVPGVRVARRLPYRGGVHGAVQRLTAGSDKTSGAGPPVQVEASEARGIHMFAGHRMINMPPLLTPAEMAEAKQRQIHALQYLDGLFADLFARVPEDTYIIVTSDHGDLFGEDGQFGHGPVVHEKVLEVPLVEGLVPSGYRTS
jgi:hypothetical protein